MPNSTDMPNECCRKHNDAGTLLKLEEDQNAGQKDLTVYRCPDCRCRHFELDADPLEIGVTFSS